MECVSTDICGLINPPTCNKRYFITFIDHFSHFVVLCLMENKSEVEELVQRYIAMVEAKFGRKLEHPRCANGGKYISKKVKKFSASKGIHVQYTIPRNASHSGVSLSS